MVFMKSDNILHWEDFQPGDVIDCGETSVDADAIVAFARNFDPQPFHVDARAAEGSMFGGLVASGWHTCGLAMRLMCDSYLLRSTSQGSPGLEEIRWPNPVRPGDRLRLRMTVEATRPLRSKPHLGLVQSRWEMVNQRDEPVLSMLGNGLFKRRDA